MTPLCCVPCRSSVLIVDPTGEEERLSTAQLTVVTDEDGRLCSVHKPGQTSKPFTRHFVKFLLPVWTASQDVGWFKEWISLLVFSTIQNKIVKNQSARIEQVI